MTSSKGARFARTLFLASACSLGFVASSKPASAEISAADLESARELYKQGKELRAAGDLKGALEKFKQGHALGQTPVTGLELGRAHMDLAQLLEAREVFLSIARLPVQPDEGEKSAGARTEAAQLAEQLRPRIPTLTVKVLGAPAGSPPVVTVDGATIPAAAVGAPRKLNPGSHEVTAKAAGGPEEHATIELKEGESKELPLTLKAPVAGAGDPLPAKPEEKGPTKTNALVYVGFGVGAVGVVAGSVTGILALGKASKVDTACHQTTNCPASAKSDVTSGRTLGTISTISFIVGGVGALVGVYGLLTPVKTAAPPQTGLVVRPEVGLGWAGLNGSF